MRGHVIVAMLNGGVWEPAVLPDLPRVWAEHNPTGDNGTIEGAAAGRTGGKAYVDDVLVDENIVGDRYMEQHLKKYGLVCNRPIVSC